MPTGPPPEGPMVLSRKCIHEEMLPWLANTHSETTITGTLMSQAYAEAKSIVKAHANASKEDFLVFCD
jgi:selenocysteine lyase/cysteine desulfurase